MIGKILIDRMNDEYLCWFWLAGLTGLVGIDDVILYLSRWDVILIVSIVIIAGYVIGTRLWPSS